MKRFYACVILCAILVGLSLNITADDGYKDISVWYGVNLYSNGEEIIPVDANGVAVYPFIYNGTTYVPMRAVSQSLGCGVSWSDNTKTVYVIDNNDVYVFYLLRCNYMLYHINQMIFSSNYLILGMLNVAYNGVYNSSISDTINEYDSTMNNVYSPDMDYIDDDINFECGLELYNIATEYKSLVADMNNLRSDEIEYLIDNHDYYNTVQWNNKYTVYCTKATECIQSLSNLHDRISTFSSNILTSIHNRESVYKWDGVY